MASAAAKLNPKDKMFHATMHVTRVEEWYVEAKSVEEARQLLNNGQGERRPRWPVHPLRGRFDRRVDLSIGLSDSRSAAMASELLRLAPPLVKPVLERTAKNPGVVSRNEHGRSALSAGMIHYRSLLAFLALVLGGGLLIGYATAPGAWYAQLAKPPFNPPDWIFAPVWAAIYVLIAIAGWRTRQREPSGVAMGLWWTQLVLNFLWSPIFFAWHRIDLAFIVIALLFAAIVGFIAASWRRDTLAVWLFDFQLFLSWWRVLNLVTYNGTLEVHNFLLWSLLTSRASPPCLIFTLTFTWGHV